MPDEKDPPDNNSRIAARPIQEPLAEILPDNLIDDTRAMKMDPMELYIGREFRLAIWEELIKTMKIGEISRFSCPYDVCTVSTLTYTCSILYTQGTLKKWNTHIHTISLPLPGIVYVYGILSVFLPNSFTGFGLDIHVLHSSRYITLLFLFV